MKNRIFERIKKYALKNRQTPEYNRRQVGKSMSILAIFLFFVFLINFAIIIGTDQKFGVNLSKGAEVVHQKTVTVAARRGTIYDRNGNVLAEDSTSYAIYAIVSTSYVSATQEKLYVQDSQFDKVADILKDKLGIEKSDALAQLRTKGAYQVSFGLKGKGITYSVKEELGKLTGDKKTEKEGAAEKVVSKVKEVAEDAKDAVEGAIEGVKNMINKDDK